VYSGLIHLLKSFSRETNFGTLPKNGMMFKSRLSQGREFLFWSRRTPNFLEHATKLEYATKLRVELTLRKDSSTTELVYVARAAGCGYLDLLDTLEVPFLAYLAEVEHVLHLGSHSAQTMVQSKWALSLAGKIMFAVHRLDNKPPVIMAVRSFTCIFK